MMFDFDFVKLVKNIKMQMKT